MVIIRKNEMVKMDKKILNDKLRELNKELIKINAQIAMGTVPENPGKIKEIRRTIARIKTMQNTERGKEKA
tara:strand:- start:848 stop:1060 length:213 start_codon:yes stop_codon:yes gene_type:complete